MDTKPTPALRDALRGSAAGRHLEEYAKSRLTELGVRALRARTEVETAELRGQAVVYKNLLDMIEERK